MLKKKIVFSVWMHVIHIEITDLKLQNVDVRRRIIAD